MEKRAITIFLATFIFLAAGAFFAFASGVASPYWNGNPLKLSPGQSSIVDLSLQNMVGSDNITLNASISSGTEIASILGDSQYNVPLGSNNVPVQIKIQVPNSAKIGASYDVEILFSQVSSGQGGMLNVASAFTTSIPVEVVGSNESSLSNSSQQGSPLLYIMILLVVLIAAVLIFLKAKRKK